MGLDSDMEIVGIAENKRPPLIIFMKLLNEAERAEEAKNVNGALGCLLM